MAVANNNGELSKNMRDDQKHGKHSFRGFMILHGKHGFRGFMFLL